jgi:hypothetical protein
VGIGIPSCSCHTWCSTLSMNTLNIVVANVSHCSQPMSGCTACLCLLVCVFFSSTMVCSSLSAV